MSSFSKLREILASEGLVANALPKIFKIEFLSEVDAKSKTTYEVVGSRSSTLGGGPMYKVEESHPRHGKRLTTMSGRKWGDLVEQARDLLREGKAKIYPG